jgi:hypothetical protein
MWVFGAWLAGCARQDVVWDEVGGRDSVDDVAVAFLLFGTREGDPETIAGPHVAGGRLTIRAAARGARSALGWTAEILAPEIAEVTVVPDGNDAVLLDLQFLRPGSTELFVFDADGLPIDVQRIAVRQPEALRLVAWDDLTMARDEPLPETVHVVPGSAVSLAVSWLDAAGSPLIGGELSSLDADSATPGVTLEPSFTGEVDVVDLTTTANASPSVFSFTLSAPTASFPRELRVHARDEADRLTLRSHTLDEEQTRGLVQAEVFSGADRMVGAPVTFSSEDGEPRVGTLLEWSTEEGPPTTVTACFDAICDTLDLPGTPVLVTSPVAPGPGLCGCRIAPSPSWMMLALLALVRRRRTA